MRTVQIETLTPVHVGSGVELQSNFEYLHFADENCLVIIDEAKVLGILGEENLPQWLACIEKKESLLALLQQRKPNIKADDVAARRIPLSKNGIASGKTVREHLHSGNDKALLPGSSLKGALRTVILTHIIRENADDIAEDLKIGVRKYDKKTNKERFDYNDTALMTEYMGKDPNHDILRLLQVGDVLFDKTECVRTDVANQQRDKSWDLKRTITQYVETIPKGQKALFRMNNATKLQERAGKMFNKNADLTDLETLFGIVNAHTQKLVETDLNYWENKANSPTVLSGYIETMNHILDLVSACDSQECILRMGYGTGYRTMTGDWHDILYDDDYFDLVKAIRTTHPETLIFPKTTRFSASGQPLGFVRLRFKS
jgi:CRISPR type III-A-associated RAMP protein Csm5